MFDIENKIREKEYINDVIVLEMPTEKDCNNLVAHIVWDEKVYEEDKADYLRELTDYIRQWEPSITLNTFAIHEGMLPYSPTTLKKDRNKLSKQLEGYVQVVGDELRDILCL